jgi:trimeric autotransporter adhesin
MRAYPLSSISLATVLKTIAAITIIAGVTIQPVFGDAACTGTFCVDGGGNNNIASATYTTVSGGNANTANNLGATIGGGHSNLGSGTYATIAGGYECEASGNWATVGGGQYNSARALNSTVAGGYGNAADAENATVSGGSGNLVSAPYGTVAGGGLNNANATPGNRVTDGYGTVGGGGNNQAGNGNANLTDSSYATVAGGLSNTASGLFASVAGGWTNIASNIYATVAGGLGNTASGIAADVAGGRSNTASGAYATIPGGYGNTASGYYSFAAGRQAKATQNGSFVWGDSTAANISSTLPNQFIARASGGVRFYSNTAATTGVSLPAGGGAWSNLSDRNMKDNFAEVDSKDVLERVASMPIQRWNYKAQDESIKHIGPTAQDFAAAFGVGENDTTISTVDTDGVALAAIQGLYQENQQLKRDLAALKAQVNAMAAASAPHRRHIER